MIINNLTRLAPLFQLDKTGTIIPLLLVVIYQYDNKELDKTGTIKPDGIVDPVRHPLFSSIGNTPEERRRFYLEYLQEESQDDLTLFHSEASVIGDEIFQSKLSSISGRKQIRRGRPSKCQ